MLPVCPPDVLLDRACHSVNLFLVLGVVTDVSPHPVFGHFPILIEASKFALIFVVYPLAPNRNRYTPDEYFWFLLPKGSHAGLDWAIVHLVCWIS